MLDKHEHFAGVISLRGKPHRFSKIPMAKPNGSFLPAPQLLSRIIFVSEPR
jgi:hypothetical protein